ncbi:MAG TPA: serine hydroxymethyltransferase [Chloroflexota bacterium]|jgi:glycine hydroxymethyltransferase|nr:serine hydroxymethyltransferase [Chloroflexota bacterium]
MAISSRVRDVAAVDPEVARILAAEDERQRTTLALIASENYASVAVRQAMASVLTNKYSEGYPGRRYYQGNHHVDELEALCIARAKELFGAEHANVQPHAGSPANMAAYLALLEPGSTILAMDLAQGGHLTHGSPVNFSGRLFRFVHYGVQRDTERIDYDEVRAIARRERPRLIVAGATAYPRLIDFAAFRAIADEVGALLLVDMAHIAGLVAGGVHPSPVPYADVVTFTTHKTLRGPRGAMILCKAQYASAIDKAVFPGLQGGPFDHAIAAKAVALREALDPAFRAYQQQVVRNARALGEALARRGLRLVSGGTDNHLLLVDLTPLGLTGAEAATRAEAAGLVTNKNMIPFDTRKPAQTSGLRLGTPAVTTRGLGEAEMEQVAELLVSAITRPDPDNLARCRAEVRALCERFPLERGVIAVVDEEG